MTEMNQSVLTFKTDQLNEKEKLFLDNEGAASLNGETSLTFDWGEELKDIASFVEEQAFNNNLEIHYSAFFPDIGSYAAEGTFTVNDFNNNASFKALGIKVYNDHTKEAISVATDISNNYNNKSHSQTVRKDFGDLSVLSKDEYKVAEYLVYNNFKDVSTLVGNGYTPDSTFLNIIANNEKLSDDKKIVGLSLLGVRKPIQFISKSNAELKETNIELIKNNTTSKVKGMGV